MQLIKKQQYYQDIKEAGGYCLHCQRPLLTQFSRVLCTHCNRDYFINASEDKSINIQEVGLITINYQQHLHRSLFGCNADYRYRGLKQDRITNNLTKEEIDNATNKLSIFLEQIPQYKAIPQPKKNPKRILYYAILYYISYFIESSPLYKTDNHFYLSMYKTLLYIIHKQHYKSTHIKLISEHKQMTFKKVNKHIPQITSIVSPLLLKFNI